MNTIDMKGQRCGHLTVIRRSPHTDTKQRAFWICKCDCGRFLIVRGDNLRLGDSTKCSDCAGTGRSRFCEGDDENGVV